MKSEEDSIPTEAERAAEHKALMQLTLQERFALMFGHYDHKRTTTEVTPLTELHDNPPADEL